MAGLRVSDGQRHKMTAVPNVFIDSFLPEANGEFVKIYLMLLRQVSEGREISVGSLAESLCDNEKTVTSALGYWEKAGVLKLEYGAGGDLEGIVIESVEDMSDGAPGAFAGRADEDFRQLLYLTEMYTGSTLTPMDCDALGNLYENLGMSEELLEYLVEECVMQGKKNINYIEKVGLDWHRRGIKTVEQAKAEKGDGNVCRVLRAFGLGRRDATPGEKQMVDTWLSDYGLKMDIIIEACERTMDSIHEPSFKYADSILKRWKEEGVSEKADIIRLDEKRKSERAASKKHEAKRTDKFNNFPQRDYDYDKLVKELNGF